MSEPGAIRRMPKPGTIAPFGGDTIPDGWLICNGAAVSRTTYKRLFDAVGTTWGAGDGSTTFNVPDGRGRVLQGADSTNSLGVGISAGAPNVMGRLSLRQCTTNGTNIYQPGWGSYGFSEETSATDVNVALSAQTTEHLAYWFNFNASTSDSRYSASTIQPEGAACNYMIRC